MAKISLEIETKTITGKKSITNVSYINPAATNEKLRQFVQMLIALTTDNYVGAIKITKESVI